MQLTGADARIRQRICEGLDWTGLTRLGLAVSGGGDSVALLHVLAAHVPEHRVTLEAATVDHGLRDESADEAAHVARTCAGLGIRHETLTWRGWDGGGNLQAAARAARYRLLADWARSRALDAVALGHTRDDVAETFLMRLAREAGVDGLSAMPEAFSRNGARFVRPALTVERGELRGFLTRHGIGWADDPGNEDARFDRVKARKALETLGGLGVDVRTLAGVAANLASTSAALRKITRDTARRIVRTQSGDVVIDRTGLADAPDEIARRLLVAALGWVSGAEYAPRRDALAGLQRAVRAGRSHTLHGCLVVGTGPDVRICREYSAVKDLVAPPGALWDNRWRIAGPGGALEVRALGEAVKDCPDWRETGLPRTSLMASPAVWNGETLIGAPVAGFSAGFTATIDPTCGDFFTYALSH